MTKLEQNNSKNTITRAELGVQKRVDWWMVLEEQNHTMHPRGVQMMPPVYKFIPHPTMSPNNTVRWP